MLTLEVNLGSRTYPIYIGNHLLSAAEIFTPHIRGHQVMVVTNETVAPLYLGPLTAALGEFDVRTVVIADGERHKNLSTLNSIFDALLGVPCDRQTTVVALGGGVVGDIAGFAAACYQRGVDLIQVPTTLLAQVDSSVGGKTAVNHHLGKNMIGAFHQPKAVIADISTLDTLADRELRAGVAEIIKYGLIRDYDFFCKLEADMDRLLERDHSTLAYCVEQSCRNKAEVVAADELERGERALLNFGHTFGHAIETATGYETWLHGEAVAAGMTMAIDLSARINCISAADAERAAALIDAARLPTSPPPDVSPEEFLQYMSVDKKVTQGGMRLILLNALGSAFISDHFPQEKLLETLKRYST